MALATQCPHCQTTFKVAHDQLKLRAGLVRCGACKQIFNGIEHLVPPDQPDRAAPPPAEARLPPAPAMAPSRPAAVPAAARPAKETSAPAAPVATPSGIDALEFVPVDDPETRMLILSPQTDDDPLTRMTLMDFSLFDEDIVDKAAETHPVENTPPGSQDDDILPDTRIDLAAFEEALLAFAPPQAPTEPVSADTESTVTPDEPVLADTMTHVMPDEPSGGALPDDDAPVDISIDDSRPSGFNLDSGAIGHDAHSSTGIEDDIPFEDAATWKMAAATPRAAFADDRETSLAEEMTEAEADVETDAETNGMDTDAPGAGDESADEGEEPGFVTSGRRRQRQQRMARIFMGTASVLLLALALAQAAYAFRSQLAAWFPQTVPALASLCELAGCVVELPAQIEQVSIESNELLAQAANGHIYSLSLLLHNRSAVAQAWPHIELTLNDQDGKALLRRALAPGEYLTPEKNPVRGIPARSEQTVKVSFELSKLQASDYRVYLFYP